MLRCIANCPSPREVLRLVTNKEAALLIFFNSFLIDFERLCDIAVISEEIVHVFANQIIRRRVSFDIIVCFSVKAFWGFPALRCTFLLDFCCEVSRGTATFTSGPIRSQMKFYILEANTKGLLIDNKNTFKTGFCKCKLLSNETSPGCSFYLEQ